MYQETTNNTTLEKWSAAMKAGERMGTLGELVAQEKVIAVMKDGKPLLRLEAGEKSSWVKISDTTRSKNLPAKDLMVTYRRKINGDEGYIAQATAPGGVKPTEAMLDAWLKGWNTPFLTF